MAYYNDSVSRNEVRVLILRLIKEHGFVFSNEVHEVHKREAALPFVVRHLNNIIREMAETDIIDAHVINMGRYGRGTVLTSKGNKLDFEAVRTRWLERCEAQE